MRLGVTSVCCRWQTVFGAHANRSVVHSSFFIIFLLILLLLLLSLLVPPSVQDVRICRQPIFVVYLNTAQPQRLGVDERNPIQPCILMTADDWNRLVAVSCCTRPRSTAWPFKFFFFFLWSCVFAEFLHTVTFERKVVRNRNHQLFINREKKVYVRLKTVFLLVKIAWKI